MGKSAIFFINIYQKYISPKKGYVCAHRHYHGGDSCSEYTKKCISEFGIIKTIPLFFERLDDCKKTFNEHQEEERNQSSDCSDKVYNVVHNEKCPYIIDIIIFYGGLAIFLAFMFYGCKA
ncbi:MAG: membrane protein insertion efficiency factor YidD [Campylobacterales bacterium]|nr:membrane protein insertion efficiency factor YidD [Campylobacterales bacterium]